jgi:serine O-acetyltransferase
LHAIYVVPEDRRTWRQRLFWRYGPKRLEDLCGKRFGASINPGAKLGRDLSLVHSLYGVFIGKTVIGDRVTIHQNVTIGHDRRGAPHIGNDVFIGANATIIGPCVIGDGARIGAGVTLVNAIVDPGEVIINPSAYSLTKGRPVHPQREPAI